VERLSLKKLNEMEVRAQYQLKISKMSAGLENVDDSWDKNWGSKHIVNYINI
jgi:hypothetical protein